MNINRTKRKNVLYPNPTDSPNLRKGYAVREGKPITVLIHSTNNTHGDTIFESEVKYLYETAINVGAEYLVGEFEVYEFLDPDLYYSWNAGDVSNKRFSNPKTIGVETHFSNKDTKPFPSGAMDNLTNLLKYLIERFDLTINDIDMHRNVATPKGRKVDPSQFTDEQFYKWRASLFTINTNDFVSYITTANANIRTGPGTNYAVAVHINDGNVINGVISAGIILRGKLVTGQNINGNDKWLWLETGWGFIHTSILKFSPVMVPTPKPTPDDIPILSNINIDLSKIRSTLSTRCVYLRIDQINEIVSSYTAYGVLTGIGSLYPLAQAIHETGWFTSARFLTAYNPAGLGATDDGAWGNTFKTISEGVLCQYAHLLAYATTDEELKAPLNNIVQCDPRLDAVTNTYGRGNSKTWKSLSNKWNTPKPEGKDYGDKIIEIAKVLLDNG